MWTPNAGNNYSRNLWEESCHASMTTIRSLPVTVRLRITREDRGANHAKVNCAGFLTRASTCFMEHPLFGEMNPCPAYPVIGSHVTRETDESDNHECTKVRYDVRTRKEYSRPFLIIRIVAYFKEIFFR